jgi:hypothetical protein
MITEFKTNNPATLTEADFADAAKSLGCEIATIKAVDEVESAGRGFLPDDRPKILFESRVFHDRTGGIYDLDNPDISTPGWIRNYLGGALEYERLEKAMKLDPLAALASCSWGRFQIMASNFHDAGYNSIESFVQAMILDEREQLRAFVTLVKSWGLERSLRDQNWISFARRYNGPGYLRNQYHLKLMKAYDRHAALEKKSVA